MPPPQTPTARDSTENKAIDEAVAQANRHEWALKAGVAAKAGTSVVAAVVLAAGVAAGIFFVLDAWNRNDDVVPIKPPPATPLEPQPPADSRPDVAPAPASAPAPAPQSPKATASGKKQAASPRPAGDNRPTRQISGPKKTEATTAQAGQGLLDVACNPECEIEIDGRPTGKRSPEKGMRLQAGKHRLRLVNRQLGLAVTDIVEIQPDRTTPKYYNLVTSAGR